MTETDFQAIYEKAFKIALIKAVENDVETGDNWFPCGRASLKLPANTKFGRWLKKNNLASKNYPTGLSIYPPNLNTQKLSVYKAWADEFSAVLSSNNIRNTVESYWD